MEKKNMNRATKRKMREKDSLFTEVIKVIYHYFPDFMKELHKIKDTRHPSYITYSSELLLIMRIFAAIGAVSSMRQMTDEFNRTVCIDNIKKLFGETVLNELPYWETINHFLVQVDVEDVQNMIHNLIYRLLRMRCFEESRIRNKYWQVIIDATHLYSFSQPHCEHCLRRVYDKGTENERTIYYHYVLEAKLYICKDLVLTLATEFIENQAENSPKQDCELAAFKRLATRIKQMFKRLPICLTMDSLYACAPVFEICEQNNWQFLIRLKEGSLPAVAKEFSMLKTLEPSQHLSITVDKQKQRYSFVTDIDYKDTTLNVLEAIITEQERVTTFVFVTRFSITTRNVIALAISGRARWCIENEGFNCQKNHGYYLSHPFSKDSNGMKVHYLLIQIAHMLVQLAMFGMPQMKKLYGSTIQFRKAFLQALVRIPLPIDWAEQLTKTFYITSYTTPY